MKDPPESGTLTTLEMSLEIVDSITELDGARVTELSDHLDLPPSTVHGHLATLSKHGYLTKEGDEYHIGMQFLNQGGYVQTRKKGYELAEEKVNKLAEQTGERVQFIVEERGRGYYIHTAVGDDAVQADARIGKRTYLHDSAAGKSILANLPDERVEQVLDRWGLPQLTDHTITDREKFFDELEAVSEQGHALNREETHNGLHAVGAPVHTPAGEVLGAFSISGPRSRLKGEWFEHELPDLLKGRINELELNLSYL
jgi:DNA-binding IclR family transcriptional regulator